MGRPSDEIAAFNRRWKIKDDQSHAFTTLKHRLTNILKQSWDGGRSLDLRFALLYGLPVHVGEIDAFVHQSSHHSYACDAITNSSTVEQLAQSLQILLLVLAESSASTYTIVESIEEAVDLTPGCGLRIVRKDQSLSVYPAGAKLLDEKAVNDVLQWLSDYPEALKPFEAALQIYSEGNKAKYRSLLDDLRLSVESLLKSVLGKKKSLENQKLNLLPWLKERGIHQQVVNMYDSLLFGQYALYQNDAVKHGEKYSNDEIEFMIYLTGTFMRMLLQLVNKKAK